jgi:aminoglycoside phosphotransferase (APT) family kinase protein
MHPDQLTVTVAAVRQLIAEQFPAWAGAPVRPVASHGTVNAIFRIGEDLAARFPLQGTDPEATLRWLEGEAAAAARLAGRTPFPTPVPVALGRPGAGYPFPWSVQTWLPGVVATDADPGASERFAADLALFIRSVRAVDTQGRTFSGTGRGGVLLFEDDWVQTCLDRSTDLLDVPRLRSLWAELRQLPRGPDPDVTNHGDLVPGNVLVAGGRLAGVLDVGGSAPADPALDLVGAWHLLEAGPRRVLRDRLGPDDAEWARGRAWAFAQAIGLVWYYADSNPVMSALGRRTLARLTEPDRP